MGSILPQQIILLSEAENPEPSLISSRLSEQGITLTDSWLLPLNTDQTIEPENTVFIYAGKQAGADQLSFLAASLPILLIIEEPLSEDQLQGIHQQGFAGCLQSDDLDSLKAILAHSLLHFQTLKQLKSQLKDVQSRLEDRKQIERAKGILMLKHHYNESQAYQLLRKLSMDRAQRMGEVAKEILRDSEIAPN